MIELLKMAAAAEIFGVCLKAIRDTYFPIRETDYMRNSSRLAGTGYLGENPFKYSFSFKNTFLITCKNHPVSARREVFQNRDLAFKNEKSCFSGMNFSM